jgi:hypothetical protein
MDVGTQLVEVSHYTSMAGFFAIVGLTNQSKQGVRLTDARSFRDSTEGSLIDLSTPTTMDLRHRSVIPYIHKWQDRIGRHFPARTDLKLFEKFESLKLFAACFTDAEDSAPHWHAYGADASGVELRLKLKCRTAKEKDDYLLGMFDVSYDDPDIGNTGLASKMGRVLAPEPNFLMLDHAAFWDSANEARKISTALQIIDRYRRNLFQAYVAKFRGKSEQFSWEKEKRLIACCSCLTSDRITADITDSGLPIWRLQTTPEDFEQFEIEKVRVSPGLAALNEEEKNRILTGFEELQCKSHLLIDTVFEFSKIKYRLR